MDVGIQFSIRCVYGLIKKRFAIHENYYVRGRPTAKYRMNPPRQKDALDPEREHQLIVHRLVCYDFPFDITRSLEFALFRTYCVPSISGLLDRTGEFARCPQKRYDDTDLIISEMLEWGYDSERGAAALQRMNAIHGHFAISNNDFLYVLSTFIFEPIRWVDRFGWRPMTQQEKLGLFYFWRAVGERMGIQAIPPRYEELEQFNIAFESKYFAYMDSNQRVGIATRDLFASWFPRRFSPVVRQAIYALLDDRTRRAFGFPRANRFASLALHSALKFRAKLLRWIPKRKRPRLRTAMRHRSYPTGHPLQALGPQWFLKKQAKK